MGGVLHVDSMAVFEGCLQGGMCLEVCILRHVEFHPDDAEEHLDGEDHIGDEVNEFEDLHHFGVWRKCDGTAHLRRESTPGVATD